MKHMKFVYWIRLTPFIRNDKRYNKLLSLHTHTHTYIYT
jgi:hypothetical protein